VYQAYSEGQWVHSATGATDCGSYAEAILGFFSCCLLDLYPSDDVARVARRVLMFMPSFGKARDLDCTGCLASVLRKLDLLVAGHG
jgi:hypothetical protein